MSDITLSVPILTAQIAFSNTSDGVADLGGATSVTMRTSADVYVGFDQPIATSQSFKLLAANTADTTIELKHGTVNKLYARGASGSGTLYLIYQP